MAGHEYDREPDARRNEISLKIEPTTPRQSHIEDETSGAIGRFGPEKIGGGRK